MRPAWDPVLCQMSYSRKERSGRLPPALSYDKLGARIGAALSVKVNPRQRVDVQLASESESHEEHEELLDPANTGL